MELGFAAQLLNNYSSYIERRLIQMPEVDIVNAPVDTINVDVSDDNIDIEWNGEIINSA